MDKTLTIILIIQITGKIKFQNRYSKLMSTCLPQAGVVIPNSLQVSIIISCIMQAKYKLNENKFLFLWNFHDFRIEFFQH